MRLKDKVAIVTGAGQKQGEGIGNGRATAITFAREGAQLLLVNRSMESLEETRLAIEDEGYSAACMVADISLEDDCRKIAQEAVAQFGRIDIVHNNVGVGRLDGDTVKLDLADWRDTLDVNLSGAMLISKHTLPAMRAQKSGCITHVSSIAAVSSYPLIAYKVSKSALNEFTRWLAFENAPYNIRCNVLMLGFIDTPLAIEGYHAATQKPREEIRRERDKSVPMGRMGVGSLRAIPGLRRRILYNRRSAPGGWRPFVSRGLVAGGPCLYEPGIRNRK